MRYSKSIAIIVAVAMLTVLGSAHAEVNSNISLGSGYQANLFSDSNTIGDSYAAAGLSMSVYPSGSTQLSADLSYNAFATYTDLSNLTGDISATVIPTSETARLSISLTGGLSTRSFGAGFEAYDRRSAGAGSNLGFRMSNRVRWMSSVYFQSENYTNADYGSNSSIDLSSGFHFSLPGANALSVRFDYSRYSYDQPTRELQTMGMSHSGASSNSQIFDIYGGMLRLSRPLGQRTGVSVSGGYRRLGVSSDYTILGYTIDYLSPWADLWEGASFSAAVKHFFPRQVIADLSAAYYDKDFVAVMESVSGDGSIVTSPRRSDQLTALALTLSRPVTLKSGNSIVPTVHVGYRHNVSSLDLYSCDDVIASISLKFSL